ncbi:uncharacterized protein LOC129565953 isoform X2 [Sitodiplosis mosellana]|uniref:uncharacterized protein LOC129565953 isoform X2 n=1 Tax=Sitodiplosis mosellana TaxID=263140 RepID=UPI00244375D6|nr:uncharacterized protein LOC129565953 isoform X2 [Sitodiplosis mosellana]
MSWFNINVNDSLNSLKGQISNVSNVVHDVFTEGILEEEPIPKNASEPSKATGDDEILIGLEEANKKIDELNSLCETKDNEIARLRQELELSKGTSSTATATASTSAHKSKHGNTQQSSLEDSWFWESEKAVSSDSSKENDGTGVAAGAVKKSPATDDKGARIVDSLRRSLDEKDGEIQRLLEENLSLNEKIKHLHRESIEQDKRLDELDQQHTEALQNLVLIKNGLQQDVATLKAELEVVRKQKVETDEKLQSLTKEHNELVVETSQQQESLQRLDELEAKLGESLGSNERLRGEVDELQAQLSAKTAEMAESREEKDSVHSREGSDKFELIDLEKEKMTSSMEIHRLQTELDEINARLSILNDLKDQYDSNVAKLGSVVSEKNSLEEQVNRLKVENESLLNEVRVARKAVDKLEEDDLVLQKEFDQLRADKEHLEETRSTQDEQITGLEAKCAELETKLQQLNVDYKKLQTDHVQCEERITELQSMHDALKSQAVDLESSLVEENMITQKQVIDLQSALNSINASESDTIISFEELKAIISKTLSYEPSIANNSLKLYLDAFLKSVKDTYQHLSDIEANRNNLMKQFESVSTDKATLQHEYKTLKADLHHYEKEVAELMKNNGILLNQLECVKAGKLETILEHNEDSILRLETQLEDTSKLNQSLQDEFENLTHKLDESEEEKCELSETIQQLQRQLDQMRTDDSKLEMQQCFEEKFKAQADRIVELTKEVDALKVDREEKQKLAAEIGELQRCKQQDAEELERLRRDFDDLEEDYKLAETCAESEKTKLEAQIDELNQNIDELEKRLQVQTASIEEKSTASQLTDELQQKIELLTRERQELVNAIQTKHNENVQYHAKIQELNQMLMTLQQTIATQSQQLASGCATCAQLTEKVTASHNEIATLTDQVTFLKEKSDILTQNLLVEQTNQKILQQEKIQLNEEKQMLNKDLNRLREHLIEMENAHTAEMIELQNLLELTRQEVANMQNEARKSNTAYTSASIRANQHTETIQAQYEVLKQQKDELSARLSEAEDRESRNIAALTNLQCVLEQFQKDKERDVEAMTNRIRNELNEEVAKRQTLLNEIQSLKVQLEESKAGLLAAARISDQLEIAQVTNATIKEELRKTQDKLHTAEAKLQETESNQADRVDKSLLKNLLIGYIMAPNNDKQQILKLISSVLDFNQQESDKVGLNRSNQGWLTSILHGSTSPNNNQAGGSYSKDSLAEAFVKFLENESRPRTDDNAPSLLSMNTPPKNPAGGDEPVRKTSAVQPILLPDAMLQTFTTPRNSSSILKDILNDS